MKWDNFWYSVNAPISHWLSISCPHVKEKSGLASINYKVDFFSVQINWKLPLAIRDVEEWLVIFNFQTIYSCAPCQLHALSCKSNVREWTINIFDKTLFLRLYCFRIEIERMLVAKVPRGITVITTVFKKKKIYIYLNVVRCFQNSL